ncbi:MAG: hypothetical protein ACHQ17_04140 [Polyangia bacterium]
MASMLALSTSFGAALPVPALLDALARSGAGGVVLDARLDPARLEAIERALLKSGSSSLFASDSSSLLILEAPCPAGRASSAALCALDRAEADVALAAALATVRRAGALGARFVVLRLGAAAGLAAEWILARDRFLRGALDEDLARRLLDARDAAGWRPLDAARRALERLARAAESLGVTLVIPNPRRFVELPSPTELELLLADAAGAPLAPSFDLPAAHLADVMGLYPLELTLAAFAPRAPLVFVGDACGPVGALAPGRGLLDVAALAARLPADAARAFSPWPGLTTDEVTEAVTRLTAL